MSLRLLFLILAGVGLLAVRAAAQSGAPTVASISSSRTLTEGVDVTLSVSVNGNAPFTYQWRKNDSAISGATTSTLAFTPIRATDAGTYTVVITNAVGTVTSGPVVMAVNAASPPTASNQNSVSVYVGSTLNLYANFSGTAPMTYVWKQGTTVLATTTSSYYSKANVTAADAGSYTITASNVAGSATTPPFTVTVNAITPPVFTHSPSSQTVPAGGDFWLSASAQGPGEITYQWRKNGTNIVGATSSYFSRSNVTASDVGSYTVTATNSAGSATSNAATITVQAPVAPTISSLSGAVAVAAGESFSLHVYASGTPPFTYQWFKDGQAITGAASSSYSRAAAQASDVGSYTVAVTNAQGSVTSSSVPVTIATARPPLIAYHPPSVAVRDGEFFWSLSVGASGAGTLTYQWRKNGVPIPGATESSLAFYRILTAADAGTYTVVVSSAGGSTTSEPCHLTLLPPTPPVIRVQPAGTTVRQGAYFEMHGYATGEPAPTLQWRKDGAALAGATSQSYGRSNVASSDAGAYSFTATNSAGSAASQPATLTVLPERPPVITYHPASASLLPGSGFHSLHIGFVSDTNATVQWYRNGVALPGSNSTTLYIYDAQPAAAGAYTAVVTNSAGAATSREGFITVDSNVSRPVITFVGGSRIVPGRESVHLELATSGSGETVQWYKDGLVIPNATGKGYSFSNFTPSSAGIYTAQVTTAGGTFTSQPIELTLADAGSAPLITREPAGQRAKAGSTVSFHVQAEGERPCTYQWRKDGVNIPGADGSSYTLSNVAATHVGAYSVVVTNRNGSATSAAAALSLDTGSLTAPVILVHPASRAFTSNSSWGELSVTLADATGVSYQWRKDGVAIPNATHAYYSPSIGPSMVGRYAVVVTNSGGSATSYDAVVTYTNVSTGPVFSTQPLSASAYFGNTVTFTAGASGASTVTYQWRKNGVDIPGATSSTLTLSNVQSGDIATYVVVASDSNGSTPSAAATLSLVGGVAPTILGQPAGGTVLAGGSVVLSVSASGTPAPTVQWRKNGINVPGATGFSLTLLGIQAGDAGVYTALVQNPVGSVTSAPATITVIYPPPTIATQPVNVTVQPGGQAVFTVVVNSVPTPTYQWRKDGVTLPGAAGSTLTLANVQPAQAGRYSVIATTNFGSVTSVEALLTVGSPVIASVPAQVVGQVGGTAVISASVQASEPLVYQWAKFGVPIAGATSSVLSIFPFQLSDVGTYSFGISRADGTVVYPLTGTAALTTVLTVAPKFPPVITQHPAASTTARPGDTVTLTVAVQSSTPVMYQWQKNGMPLPDQFAPTLTLRNVQLSDAADYRAVAISADGSTPSNLARVIVEGSAFTGSYSSALEGPNPWMLFVRPDGSAIFLGVLSARGQAVLARNVVIAADGSFHFGNPAAIAPQTTASTTSQWFDGLVQGRIEAGGMVSAQAPAANVSFIGGKLNGAPMPSVVPGYYEAVPPAADVARLDGVIAADGTVLLVATDSSGVLATRAISDSFGFFGSTVSGHVFTGNFDGATGKLSGVHRTPGGATIPFATPAGSGGMERMMNVATRGLAGSGAQTLTAGFVISGTTSKDVLIRAVGPGLTPFGVTGVLGNPRLRIFRGPTPLIENDDWSLGGFAAQIVEAGVRVGAFALEPGSADAAIAARLEPGAYTAQITGDAIGVTLVEVYDTTTPSAGAPRLANLSTRGEVGRDGDILIVGVVVSGEAAKRVLIRGIGPGLEPFGVTGALSDPRLQLFQGSTLLRENDNWSDSADVAGLVNVAGKVGAFDLPSGSKDAALLVYLAPGSYTAQVSGVGGVTGVALVELYEVP